jgi:DNA repair exonuclease SbcCD ATPase subunit
VTLAEVERSVRDARADYEGRAGQARMLVAEIQRTKDEIATLEARIDYLRHLSALLSTYADDRQTVVQGQIEGIVSAGLKTIFGEDLSLRIQNRMVGKRPELDFVLVSQQGTETLETSILDSRGGGVAVVAGFLIQAVLVLLTPNLRKVVFLDESFAQVSDDFLVPLGEFVQELTKKSPLQVVLVTHQPVFTELADKVYRFSQASGVTHVIEEGP